MATIDNASLLSVVLLIVRSKKIGNSPRVQMANSFNQSRMYRDNLIHFCFFFFLFLFKQQPLFLICFTEILNVIFITDHFA